MTSALNLIQKKKETIIVLLLDALFSFFFLLNSPLHPWIYGDSGMDSSVFKTIAMMINKGYMPYKDSFDHKGPFLYVLEWLGYKISAYRGIWVIEFLFLVTTIYFMYLTVRIFCSSKAASLIIFLSLSPLSSFFEGGNLVEEYAMCFVSISLYAFLTYLVDSSIGNIWIVVIGACFCCTMLLRPNMIGLWIVMCIAIAIILLRKKEFKELFSYILFFIIGMLIVAVPIIIWLGVNDALTQCWKDYILFNFTYTSENSPFSLMWDSFITFLNNPVILVAFLSEIVIILRKKESFHIIHFISMLLSLIFLSMGGRTYGHYGMVLIPLITVPFASLVKELENIIPDSKGQLLLSIISIYVLSTLVFPNYTNLLKKIPASYETRNVSHISDTPAAIADYIEASTNEDEKISVYGNWDLIYVLSNRAHATRYSYQMPIGDINPTLMDDYFSQLSTELPKLIVVPSGKKDERIKTFLLNNDYNIVWSENGEYNDGALIYQR